MNIQENAHKLKPTSTITYLKHKYQKVTFQSIGDLQFTITTIDQEFWLKCNLKLGIFHLVLFLRTTFWGSNRLYNMNNLQNKKYQNASKTRIQKDIIFVSVLKSIFLKIFNHKHIISKVFEIKKNRRPSR